MVNNFLFCCELETGGYVLGLISAFFSGILLVMQGQLVITLLSSYWFDELYVMQVIFFMLFLCLVLYASINLIRGTSNSNHVQMRPYLIMMIVELVLWLLYSCSNADPDRSSIVLSIIDIIICAIIEIYLFICIYSLYEKTKKASFNAGAANNQPPANLYPAQSVVIYSTQPTNNDGGLIYDQKEANRPAPMYSNQPPSYPGFVNTLSPDNSVIVVTSGKE